MEQLSLPGLEPSFDPDDVPGYYASDIAITLNYFAQMYEDGPVYSESGKPVTNMRWDTHTNRIVLK